MHDAKRGHNPATVLYFLVALPIVPREPCLILPCQSDHVEYATVYYSALGRLKIIKVEVPISLLRLCGI